MRSIGRVFAVAILAGSASLAMAVELLPDVLGTDTTQQAAKAAEEKGDLARIRNNYMAAALAYQRALRLDSQNSELYNKLGIVEIQLGERPAARKNFNLSLKYDPRNVQALNNLGALWLLDRKYKPALRYLKESLALDESNASAHVNLGDVWMGMKQTDRAMTEYSRALELDADVLSSDSGGLVALVKTPEQQAIIDFLIARAYAKRGNIEGALEYLGRAKDNHFQHLHDVYSDQEFAGLWTDPRLAKIVKQ